MKFQIWVSPDKCLLLPGEPTPREQQVLRVDGYELEHEFEAVSKENAEAYFVAWCDNQEGVNDAKVQSVAGPAT